MTVEVGISYISMRLKKIQRMMTIIATMVTMIVMNSKNETTSEIAFTLVLVYM